MNFTEVCREDFLDAALQTIDDMEFGASKSGISEREGKHYGQHNTLMQNNSDYRAAFMEYSALCVSPEAKTLETTLRAAADKDTRLCKEFAKALGVILVNIPFIIKAHRHENMLVEHYKRTFE